MSEQDQPIGAGEPDTPERDVPLAMTAFEAKPETDRGRAMFQELLWVHAAIRRDLETVERLAGEVGNGLPGDQVQEALEELKTNGPLWRLKVSCLRYCRFVHSHHGAEDALLFPALRAANPSIDSTVDRLEADHARVSDLLDAVEDAARALTESDGDGARERVVEGLGSCTATCSSTSITRS